MGSEITLINGSFSGADASTYYGLVRKLQPRHVVEVGAGWSSIFLAHALERNERPAKVTLIEPEPDRRLLERLPREWEVRPSLLQFADPRSSSASRRATSASTTARTACTPRAT